MSLKSCYVRNTEFDPTQPFGYIQWGAWVISCRSTHTCFKLLFSSLYGESIIFFFYSRTYNGFQRDAFSLRSWLVSSLPSSVYALSDYNFDDLVLRSSTPWVIDYYAPWCGPCQVFAVEFELAAKQLDDGRRLKFAKVNCDSFPLTCRKAGIQAYPSVRYYPGKTGWALQNAIGIPFVNDRKKKEELVEWLEELLSQSSSASGKVFPASGNKPSPNSRDEL